MSLADPLRRKLAPALWERAEAWVRSGAVGRVAVEGAHERWLVRVPGGGSFEVELWPEEPDWACGCELEACAHAAAVALARDRGAFGTVELPRITYTLRRRPDGLEVDRLIPPGAVRAEADQALGRVLAGWWGQGAAPRGLLREALGWMRDAPVTLDGEAIGVDPTPVRPRVRVQDEGPGWKVCLVRAPGILEAFRNGVVRVAGGLRPYVEPELDPVFRERLIKGIPFAPREVERLVTVFLPELRTALEVDVVSGRLPAELRVPPRFRLDVAGGGTRLRVTAELVYGEPPVAKVEHGELVRIGGALPRRDPEAERRLLVQLGEAGLAPGLAIEREGADAARWVAGLPAWAADAILSHAPGWRVLPGAAAPTVAIQSDGDGFRVTVGGGTSAAALLHAWETHAPLVPLLEGGWRPTPRAWLEQHGAVLAELLSAVDREGRVARQAAPLLLDAAAALDVAVPPALGALRALAGDFDAIPNQPLPPGFAGSLRAYQQRGVDWIAWLGSVGMGGVLADDMGLGKTVQCLAALAARGGRALVVAPTSVVRNWASEAARFVPGLKVALYHGPRRELDPDAALTLTTWAILRLDIDLLADVAWDTLILDEAQAIKNPESQVAAAARRIPAALRLAVTGTPVENRLDELWSLFHVVNPGLLGSRRAFRDRFEGPVADGSRRARDELRRRIRPFVLRRLKQEVATELPPRTDVVLRCALSADERSLYESLRGLGRADVAKLLDGGRTLQVLEVLLRLRQAACHPGLLPGKSARSSAKVDLLVETLSEVVAEGHRALVFSQWTSFLDLIEPELREAGLGYCRLDGTTRDRAGVVARFSADDGPPVFLLSLTAGGTGLNLTAADYVFILDPWWNPAVEQQATDRAHRIGQERPVVAYRLVAEDTVEERILALQDRKRALAAATLDDAALAQGVTRDDLLALFDG